MSPFPLFAAGTFVYLEGGSLDVGVVRDQTLWASFRVGDYRSATWVIAYAPPGPGEAPAAARDC